MRTLIMIEVIFFSGSNCGVCQVMKPKLLEAIEKNFCNLDFKIVSIEDNVEFTAQHLVFTLPVLIIKVDGNERKRFVRSFGVNEVVDFLHRII